MKSLESGLRVRVYPVLEEAIEVGVLRGLRRAHKHVENPSEQDIRTAIEQTVMEEMCQRFDIVDGEG